MGYEFGQLYGGFFASDYEAIVGTNETLAEWIADNMELVADGKYYVYAGDQFELMELFELYDRTDFVTTFTYLRSTWQLSGF